MMIDILLLPGHLLDHILLFLDPADIVNWALASTANYAHISSMLRAVRGVLLGGHKVVARHKDPKDILKGPALHHHLITTLVCNVCTARRLCVEPYKSNSCFCVAVDKCDVPESKSFGVNISVRDSRALVDTVLHRISTWSPSYITISCDTGCERILTNTHLRHLRGITHVLLLGHHGISDHGLTHLARAHVLVIKGCKGIKGEVLPHLVYTHHRLFHIDWALGWGLDQPFVSSTRRWLQRQHEEGLIVSL